MLKEFREFILRGSLVDLAVAVVIGTAFSALVTSFVANLITPLIAAVGGQPDFSALTFEINGRAFRYGAFLNALFSFLSSPRSCSSSSSSRSTRCSRGPRSAPSRRRPTADVQLLHRDPRPAARRGPRSRTGSPAPLTAGHTRSVPPIAASLEELLRPLREDPANAAVLLDVDGVLAPIVQHADDAHMPETTRRPLIEVAKRYGVVACVSGRRASDARRIVSLGSIAYLGSHGSEVLRPGLDRPGARPRAAGVDAPRAGRSATTHFTEHLRRLRVRLEDKEAIAALHWRGVPDEDGAQAAIEEVAERAEQAGFTTHWGRKVLEIRPPVRIDKGAGIVALLRDIELSAAVYVGDDVTDLDAFRGLDELVEMGGCDARSGSGCSPTRARRRCATRRTTWSTARTASATCSGRSSTERRAAGRGALRRLPPGDGDAQRRLGHAARGVTVIGVSRELEPLVVYVALGWWVVATAIGVALGAAPRPRRRSPGCWPTARTQTSLPELQPGVTLLNRLWPLLLAHGRRGGPGVLRAAGGGGGGRLRDHLGARLAPPARRRGRRSRSATACASTSTGRRRCAPIRLVRTPGFGGDFLRARRHCVAPPGLQDPLQVEGIGRDVTTVRASLGVRSRRWALPRCPLTPAVPSSPSSPCSSARCSPSAGARRPGRRPAWPPTAPRPTACGRSSAPSSGGSPARAPGWPTPRRAWRSSSAACSAARRS